jgi:hypothetical protein
MLTRRGFLKTAAAIIPSMAIAGKTDNLPYFDDAKDFIELYDMYIMAMYFDGTTGPKTGIIKAEDILAYKPVDYVFWHGHGGINHEFTFTLDAIDSLKQLKKTYLQTDIVANHSHKIFIDPTDIRYRVPGSKPIKFPKQILY